jgi:hypothetical protein
LTPEHIIGQELAGFKGDTEQPFLLDIYRASVKRGDTSCNGDELLIEKGGTGLETVRGNTAIRSEDIEIVNVSEESSDLGLKGVLVGGVLEIEIGSPDLVGSVAVEDDLTGRVFADVFRD